MATLVQAEHPPARVKPLRPARSRLITRDIAGPVLVVSLLLGVTVASGLAASAGSPLGFVRFGRAFAPVIHPPGSAPVAAGTGYDGQYFWVLGSDPLLRHAGTLLPFLSQGFRLQRIAYPALAWVLSGGRSAALGWSLLAVNLAVIVAATLGFAVYARRRGWSGWWALCVGLLPGFAYALLGDLSDALATGSMLGGMIAWRHRRGALAAVLLAVACLAREPMVLAVAAIALDAARRRPAAAGRDRVAGAVRAMLIAPVIVPGLAFALWQVYIRLRLGASTGAPATAFAPPLSQFALEAHRALHARRALDGIWDETYLAVMLAGIALALVHLRRGVDPLTLAACAFALALPVLVFGGAWSYARLSAPMLGCLLLIGLERWSRPILMVCVLSAMLGALVPLSLG